MLSIRQIDKLMDAAAHRRLAQRILANGRCQEPAIVDRLLEPGAVAPAALGLALQRMLELSWGPTGSFTKAVRRLLVCQDSEGLFRTTIESLDAAAPEFVQSEPFGRIAPPGAVPPSPALAATAVALRALSQWRDRDLQRTPGQPSSLVGRVGDALERGTAAMARRLSHDLVDAVSPVDAAIVAWQLAEVEPIADRLDLGALRARLRRDDALTAAGSLFEYAYSNAA